MSLSRYDTWVRSPLGFAIPGANIYLCTQPASVSSVPPSPATPIFADAAGTLPLPGNTLQTDGLGHAGFYVAPGVYTLVIVLSGKVTNYYPDQLVNALTSIVLPSTGNGSLIVSAAANIQTAPNGDLVVTDGFGNARDSGTQLSTLATTASVTAATAPLATTASVTAAIAPLAPKASPTFSGEVTTGNVDNIIYVDGVNYTTIASAIAALPTNGGEVVCPPGYRETITSQITLGDNTTKAVILRMMNNVILTINITDNTKSAFVIGEASGIIGVNLGAPNRNSGCLIELAATCNIVNVITTGSDNPQAFVLLEKFSIDNGYGGAVSNAFVNLVNLNNASTIRDLNMAYCPKYGINIESASGGTVGPLVIDNCYIYGGLTNSKPLMIQSTGNASVVGVTVLGGYYNGCGTNLANIEINGNGNTTSALRDINLIGCYLEQESPATTTTGIKIEDAAGVTVIGCEFGLTTSTSGHTGISITQSGTGRTHSIVVINFRLSGPGTQAGLTNIITGDGPYLTSTGSIPFYGYQGTSGTQTASAFILGSDTTLNAGDNCTVGINLGTYNLTVAGEVGFYGHAIAAKPTVTGSRGGNAALASLLTALAGLGLLTDSSS